MWNILTEVFEKYSEAIVNSKYQFDSLYPCVFYYTISSGIQFGRRHCFGASFIVDSSGRYLCIKSAKHISCDGKSCYAKRMSKKLARMIISFLNDGKIVKVKREFTGGYVKVYQ
jgi:hypothetical protein